jgi:hypothetical protein
MSKKISQFPIITTRNNNDWLLIEEAATGAYKRIKVSDFTENLGGGASIYGQYASVVLQDNPLLYYQFKSEFGAILKDDSGLNNNNGIYSGSVTKDLASILANSSYGGSISFPGAPTNAVVYCPSIAYLNDLYTSDYSLEAWIKPTAYSPNTTTNNRGYILCKLGYHIGLSFDYQGKFAFNVFRNSGDVMWDTPQTYALNNVYHIISAFDWINDRFKLYVNSSKQIDVAINKANTIRVNTNQWQIGQGNSGGQPYQNPFLGLVSNVAIYGKVLTQEQVTTHYQTGITA